MRWKVAAVSLTLMVTLSSVFAPESNAEKTGSWHRIGSGEFQVHWNPQRPDTAMLLRGADHRVMEAKPHQVPVEVRAARESYRVGYPTPNLGVAETTWEVSRVSDSVGILESPPEYHFARLSPDGSRYAITDAGFNGVTILDLKGKSARTITAERTEGIAKASTVESARANEKYHGGYAVWARNPVWSPDGAWIAFESNRSSQPGQFHHDDIWVVGSEGGNEFKLVDHNDLIAQHDNVAIKLLGWSAEGRVVFQVGSSLYWVPAMGGKPSLLAEGVGSTISSPDGRFILSDNEAGLLVIATADGTVWPIDRPAGTDSVLMGGWSPDSTRVSFLAYASVTSPAQVKTRQTALVTVTVGAGAPTVTATASPLGSVGFDIIHPPVWGSNETIICTLANGDTYMYTAEGR